MDIASVSSMTVAALRKQLRGKGQDARGNKATLIARLTAVLQSEAPEPVPDPPKPSASENPAPQVAEEEPIEAYEEIEEEPTTTVEPVQHIAAAEPPVATEEIAEPPQEKPSEDILSEEKMKKRALRFGLPWPPPPQSKAVEKENVIKPASTKPLKKGKRARDTDGEGDESPKKKLATGKKGKKQTQNVDDERRANGKNRRANARQMWEEDRTGNRAPARDDRIGNRIGRDDRGNRAAARDDRGGREDDNFNRRDGARRDGAARRERGVRRSPEAQRDLRVNGGVGKRARNVKARQGKRDEQPKNEGKVAVSAPIEKVEVSKEELAKREARAKRFGHPSKTVS